MRRLIAGILGGLLSFCVASVACAEIDPLNAIAARIDVSSVIRAEFTQTKEMPALKRPLVTRGRLTFSRERGVLWQIEAPFKMSYVLMQDRIIEISADGVRRERSARDLPGLAEVGRIFRAVLGARAEVLREHFELTVSGNPKDQWGVSMVPKRPELRQFILEIDMRGGRFVDAFMIREANGDTTRFVFKNTVSLPALDEDEARLFESPSTLTPKERP